MRVDESDKHAGVARADSADAAPPTKQLSNIVLHRVHARTTVPTETSGTLMP
jgi:hypothetical protein